MLEIKRLIRYPVKGLSGTSLTSVDLKARGGMPLDRIYAIEGGSSRFDPLNPKWLPKTNFLVLMRYEKVAALETDFREDDHTLKISRGGKQVAAGSLKSKLGRQIIEQFFAGFMKHELKGAPKIVFADDHQFTDIAPKALHLVNLATVSDLGRIAGEELDPLRFRGNIYFEGASAWDERNWVGKRIRSGDVVLKIFADTGRCEATSVNLATATRGQSIPSLMERVLGHNKLGFYAL